MEIVSMRIKVWKPVLLGIVFLAFLLIVFGCSARIDFLSVVEDKSSPDINIKISGSVTLLNGSGCFDFGSVQVETIKTAVFTIENTGLLPLNIESVSLSSSTGGEFTVSIGSSIQLVEPNHSVSFNISFNPSFEGYTSATVLVVSDDPDENHYTFTVEGYGSPIPVPDIILRKEGAHIPSGAIGHDFGTVLIGDYSEAAQLTVINEGTAALIMDSISISLSDYLLDDLSTSYTLQPGESTTFDIVFFPLDTGERSATISIENNDPEDSLYSFTVTGIGEPKVPDVYVLSAADEIPNGSVGFDYGNVMVGDVSSPHLFTIGNRGTAPLNISSLSSTEPSQFVIDATDMEFTLQPGDVESTSFSISFEPVGQPGLKFAEIVLSSDDPDTGEFSFTVVGYASPIPVPDIEILRDGAEVIAGALGFDFGPVESGQTSTPVIFTIRNSGDADLTVTGISSSSADFSIADTPLMPCDISSNGSETFTVTFSPSGLGLSSAAITIINNDPDENVFTFYIQGRTALPDIRILKGATPITNGEPDAHDFGTVLIGDWSLPVMFTIENNGEADLLIGSISFSDGNIADFTLDDSLTSYTISPGSSSSFSIVFMPTDSAHRWATISIANNDTLKDPYTFTVEGMGEPKVPDIHLRQGASNFPNGSSYDFGTVLIGSSASVQFTIRNYGTGDLTVFDISSSSGEFTLASAPSMPFTVSPGSSRYITFEFFPAAAGERVATISIPSDDPDGYENPYTFTLRGYGETPVPDIEVRQELTPLPNGSGIFFFGHVQEGDSKSETFTIENHGTASLIISGILLTDGHTDQFSINYSIPPIGPGGSRTFTVVFTPTYPGDKWAEITIVSNDPDEDLYTFLIEGMVGLPPVVDIEVWQGATYYPDNATYNGFGNVQVGDSSAPVLFTIWNNGPDDLLIPSIVIVAGDVEDFDLDLNATDLNSYISPGWSTNFRIFFTPQTEGDKWLLVHINYNDPVVTPYILRFEGTGED